MKEFFIERAKKIYGENTYSYDAVEYVDMNTKVKVFCNIHQEYFYIKPMTLLYGHGCPKCNKQISEDEFK